MPRRSSVFPTAYAVEQEIKEALKEVAELRRLHRFLVKMEKGRGQPAPAPIRTPVPTENLENGEAVVAPGYDQ